MTERHAACSCGKLAVSVRGEPVRISVCHCLACQRRTGSAFGAQARFRRSDVEVEGTTLIVARDDEGLCAAKNRCPHLGLSLTKGPGGLHAEGGEIVCPWHSSKFDLCSGENRDWVAGFAGRSIPRWSRSMVAMGRKPSPLTTYPVSRDGGSIVVAGRWMERPVTAHPLTHAAKAATIVITQDFAESMFFPGLPRPARAIDLL